MEIKEREEGASANAQEEKKKKKKKKPKKQKLPPLTAEEQVWRNVFEHMEKRRITPIVLFHEINEDEDGTITPDELRAGFKRILNLDLTDEEFANVIAGADRDGSGVIEYKELAREIKYGDPRRRQAILSREKKQVKVTERLRKNIQAEDESKKASSSKETKSAVSQLLEAGKAFVKRAIKDTSLPPDRSLYYKKLNLKMQTDSRVAAIISHIVLTDPQSTRALCSAACISKIFLSNLVECNAVLLHPPPECE